MKHRTKWTVAVLLAFVGLLSAGRAEAAKGGLPQCTADLAICQTGLTDAQAHLATCTNDLTTTEGELATCTNTLATTQTSLNTCSANLAACQAQAVCGDGGVGSGEDCDVGTLNGATCQSEGFAGGGTLTCGTGCTFDTSECFATRFEDNSDGTITDHQTGLVWEKKTGGASSSFDSRGVGNCLNCVQDTYNWTIAMSEWLSALNGRTDDPATQTGYAGHSDWRPPTIVELKTILDFGAGLCGGGGGPCVDPVFNDSDSFTEASGYWSATSLASFPGSALGFDFGFGFVFFDVRSGTFHVRAVRGGL